MKGCLLGVSKLVIGVTLALFLLSLAGVATARYFMARLSVLPPRPAFSNDNPSGSAPPTSPSPAPEAATPAPTPEPAAAPVEEKPPGSYDAIVVQPVGLILRSGPGTNFDRMGGVDNQDRILVLKTSDDGQWLNIRIPDTGQEGWVKAGNTRAVDGE
ncbi:MAG: SH3 domain-containing protein [Leptolyngbyaceae cyanobacterium T60_A2020_046]|nr:SH3 domain-containing protein [Leptolyngbyaceae cyanobacterium T60_A2020_046]